ncbi:MAG TPA: hypothetical protein VF634_12320 [Pyrinomonadaceae bacterium]|jgi:hypothetical protein
MANDKIKFKVSIEKLTFEYEGDRERGAALQSRLTDTLGSLAAAQGDVIDITPSRQLPAAPAAPAPTKRRARRRPSPPAVNANGASSADSNGAGGDEQAKAARKRKARGTSYRAQISNLVQEGYFKQKRGEQEVRDELHRRGHTFELHRIKEGLLAQTQSKKLDREMNAAGDWEYKDRPAA